MSFVLLHGFLGQGSDWNRHLVFLKKVHPEAEFWVPSFFHPHNQQPFDMSLEETMHFLLSEIKQRFPRQEVTLVGYSMGARWALHLALMAPELFTRVKLLAGHPGLLSLKERQERHVWAQDWSQRFLDLQWDEVLSLWNAQEIFSSQNLFVEPHPPRLEVDYSRCILASVLRRCSVSQQSVALEDIKALGGQLEWYVGAQDVKYLQLYDSLQVESVIQGYKVISDWGHRLIFAPPECIYSRC